MFGRNSHQNKADKNKEQDERRQEKAPFGGSMRDQRRCPKCGTVYNSEHCPKCYKGGSGFW